MTHLNLQKITKRWYYSTAHWHLGDVLVSNHLFVIFAVLGVSFAVNSCLNRSFFTFIWLSKVIDNVIFRHIAWIYYQIGKVDTLSISDKNWWNDLQGRSRSLASAQFNRPHITFYRLYTVTRKTRSSAIADKPRVLFCKVVEVLQDVLSENVDKKFTT